MYKALKVENSLFSRATMLIFQLLRLSYEELALLRVVRRVFRFRWVAPFLWGTDTRDLRSNKRSGQSRQFYEELIRWCRSPDRYIYWLVPTIQTNCHLIAPLLWGIDTLHPYWRRRTHTRCMACHANPMRNWHCAQASFAFSKSFAGHVVALFLWEIACWFWLCVRGVKKPLLTNELAKAFCLSF